MTKIDVPEVGQTLHHLSKGLFVVGSMPSIGGGYLLGCKPLAEFMTPSTLLLSAETADQALKDIATGKALTDEILNDLGLFLGLKLYNHIPPHDRNKEDIEKPDTGYSLTMLVNDGHWHQEIWSDHTEKYKIELTKPGQFILWHGSKIFHSWKTVAKSTMHTLRWLKRSSSSPVC